MVQAVSGRPEESAVPRRLVGPGLRMEVMEAAREDEPSSMLN